MICLLEARSDSAEEVKTRLLRDATSFRKDPETIEWSIQQDVENPNKFCIVERYEREESEKLYHQNNPDFKPLIQFLSDHIVKPFELKTFTV
nr:uncharacterized protein I303_08253 [Kwoniella dejecticola CBS 10117]OBR81483.1 hypothetical protein I303_08253 [Kwoniella dejecticola CBS 10117]